MPLGLYVHLPFCVDRCHYCYYLSYDDRLGEMDRYLAALRRELAIYAETPALAGRPLSFVYFGGGTPSLLSTRRIERLMGELAAIYPWEHTREVCFECAPKSTTAAKLRSLRDCGVTRISLGVQQLDDAVLQANGRVHLVADVAAAFESIRQVGFEVTNVDLIVGLVGETDDTFFKSLDSLIEMAPDSVTIYQLEIPMNTPLSRSIRDGDLALDLASWSVKRARMRQGMQRLAAAGYARTSAYAAVREPVRHRFVYQVAQYQGADLVGIGTSAFSHLGGYNQQNRTDLTDYLESIERGELPLSRAYLCSPAERLLREFLLQLKLGQVDRREFVAKFGAELSASVFDPLAEPLREFERDGLVALTDEVVTVTLEGLLWVDRMLPALYLPEHRGVRYS